MATSPDGLAWSAPRTVASAPEKNLCEPCALRSPDGAEIALLLRENRHTGCSMMCFSRDEGATWSPPIDTAPELTGDRHEGVVLPDGRLFIAFRDRMLPLDGKLTQSRGERRGAESLLSSACCRRNGGGAVATSTYGHYVAWVGTWDDLRHARPGLCRVKLLHSHAGEEGLENASFVGDTGYSGVELLPDGELLCTTYVKYWPDARKHSVVSTRLRLDEIDRQPSCHSPAHSHLTQIHTGENP
jgi:hypothetical protein